FEDPETHEKGVNNQMFRAMGCYKSYKAGTPPNARPMLPENEWDAMRNQTNAWLITVTAANGFDKDGDVTVTFDRALQRVTRAAVDNTLQADMTYTIDPDPRSHNVLKGQIRGGKITTETPEVNMVGD